MEVDIVKFFVIPYRGRCKKPGAELGPVEIIKNLAFYNRDCYEIKSITEFENVHSIQGIKDDMKCALKKKERVIVLGGDHSTTAYVVNKLLGDTREFSCIIFDAHNDYSEKKEEKYCNWNVINHIEECVKEGMVIGYRNKHKEMPECTRFTYYSDITPPDVIKNTLINFCCKNEHIYLSIDVDSINPLEFPGTGYKCSGGIFVRELVEYVNIIKKYSKSLIIDIVEFNPLIEKDISIMAIQRILECLSY